MTSSDPTHHVSPMFPLGGVLVPSMDLPLHVFEPRYRQLVRDCLSGTPEFGVVLIERGHEVGGGDVRTSVGTVARIVEAAELPDGRFALATVGVRRVRVTRWLEDDPYPRAEVVDWPDEPGAGDLGDVRDAALSRMRHALALQTELGSSAPPATIEVSDDLVLASYQITALSPLGPLDRQRLLSAPGPEPRLREAADLLDGTIEMLEARLASD